MGLEVRAISLRSTNTEPHVDLHICASYQAFEYRHVCKVCPSVCVKRSCKRFLQFYRVMKYIFLKMSVSMDLHICASYQDFEYWHVCKVCPSFCVKRSCKRFLQFYRVMKYIFLKMSVSYIKMCCDRFLLNNGLLSKTHKVIIKG